MLPSDVPIADVRKMGLPIATQRIFGAHATVWVDRKHTLDDLSEIPGPGFGRVRVDERTTEFGEVGQGRLVDRQRAFRFIGLLVVLLAHVSGQAVDVFGIIARRSFYRGLLAVVPRPVLHRNFLCAR